MCRHIYGLVSKFGEGDGSELPQLHITRTVPRGTEGQSIYYAFHNYFEQLWSDAKEWDYSG